MTTPYYDRVLAEAMSSLGENLKSFSPEERLVMLSKVLGDTLCELGVEPDKNSAIMLCGIAMEIVIDRIKTHFWERGEAA